MLEPAPIRILAPATKTGDLFGRLVADLFLALGYDEPRLNIHKAGREIDVEAHHRTEPRRVVAECKATAKPIGGADIDKFVGVLDAERRKARAEGKGEEVVGYFVSLSGFTETAVEQERDCGDPPRCMLVTARQLVEQLIKGRIVVSPGRALERAGRCASASSPDLHPDEEPQLLAHKMGWIWAVLFRRNAEITHLSLIHADGEALSVALAKAVLVADRKKKGDLHRLTYLPPEPITDISTRLLEAQKQYFKYLSAECGSIEIEGLPADQDVGSKQLRLESLFVPLNLESLRNEHGSDGGREAGLRVLRVTVGEALARRPRLAILALPGGGKTTLLKRLAVAYAFPERRDSIGDQLPKKDWFPVFLRCRQIEEQATAPITTLLARLGERAEMADLAEDFKYLLYAKLREGKVLLLIDGLDEIADSGKRAAFISQVRTFLSTYPAVDVVITSREAGFRSVAGSISSHCDHYRIADFNLGDIRKLTVAWYRQILGDGQDVEMQARSLAVSIWETDRVRRLAVNPLLLTTLLLVRRWVGQLPSQRSVLYEKAIEILLWTWNVQGFEPLDPGEIMPQLAFLAWQMMAEGTQTVSRPRLYKILQAARQQMPEVLSYAKLSIVDFIDRVEQRSGLLVLSGHKVEEGRLVPVYEFRHLTFQEYLTAKAVVDGYYPDQKNGDTLELKLGPYLFDPAWFEVILLAGILAGRRASPLVVSIVDELEGDLQRRERYGDRI
jgi:hypothetical protein